MAYKQTSAVVDPLVEAKRKEIAVIHVQLMARLAAGREEIGVRIERALASLQQNATADNLPAAMGQLATVGTQLTGLVAIGKAIDDCGPTEIGSKVLAELEEVRMKYEVSGQMLTDTFKTCNDALNQAHFGGPLTAEQSLALQEQVRAAVATRVEAAKKIIMERVAAASAASASSAGSS